jgi:hypothetical protein
MSIWMSDEHKKELLRLKENMYKAGFAPIEDILRSEMELEALEAQIRAAAATEVNAKYMLWSVIVAALAAFGSAASAYFAWFGITHPPH